MSLLPATEHSTSISEPGNHVLIAVLLGMRVTGVEGSERLPEISPDCCDLKGKDTVLDSKDHITGLCRHTGWVSGAAFIACGSAATGAAVAAGGG